MTDFAAAFCVGISETLFGYPFLTAKVLIQNREKWWGHKISRYYRGVRYPLMSSIGFNTVVFPTENRTFNYTNSHFLSGVLAGVVVTPQMYFIDTYTIRSQTNQTVSLSMFKGSRGFASTMCRETMALGVYFESYNRFKDQTGSFVAGGISGLLNWTATFPVDTVRCRQIAQRCSIVEAIKMGSLWKGYSLAATRAVWVNSISFTVFDTMYKYLS